MGHALAPEGVGGRAGKSYLKGMSWPRIISWPRKALNAVITTMVTEQHFLYHWFVSPLSPYLYCAVLGSLNKRGIICSKYFGCTSVCASTSCILVLPSPEVSLPSGGSFSMPGKSLVNSHQPIFGPFPFHWNSYLLHLVVLCFINSVVLHCSYLCSLCMFQHLLKFLVLFIIRFSTRESGRPRHKIWRQLSNGCASTLGKE